MDYKEQIGKKVWVKENYVLKDRTEYTLVEVLPPNKDNHEWAENFLVEGNGERKIVNSIHCTFCPDRTLKAAYMVEKYLNDNSVYAEIWDSSEDEVIVSIEWGDWKHDHAYCRYLMGLIGYEETDEEVTEENGSDCYSATHTFQKIQEL